MRSFTLTAVALVATAAVWILFWRPSTSTVQRTSEPSTTVRVDGPAVAGSSIHPARQPVDPTAPEPATPLGFRALTKKLVDLTLRGTDEVQRQDLAAAAKTNDEVLVLVETILTTIADYEQQALFALTGIPSGEDLRLQAERSVFGRLLHLGLQKLATFACTGTRQPLDDFLRALLEVMVPYEQTAAIVAWLLVDQPYLGVPQEEATLRLAELVPTFPWLGDPARKLLLTLWHNLEATGARARDQVETLALMLKDDTNPARRAAALERLVTSSSGELVDFVLRDIEERRDSARARDLAAAAAAKLPIEQALSVVQRLRALAPQALMGPALELARRDGERVRAFYNDLVAADQDADLRADLISGLGFNPSTDNLEVVEHAFRGDRHPRVRERALLALTANASATFGESVVSAALTDATFAGERLGFVVGALQNLAHAGQHAMVERLGRRMAARLDLPPSVRAELEQLLREGPAGHAWK